MYALDADVLIGALDGADPHHVRARQLFTTWHEHDDSTLMSVVNLSEVLVAPSADRQRLRAAREAIAALGVSIHSPTEAVGVDAARLRGRHSISLPDAYLLATARHTSSSAVSFDRKIARAAAAEGISMTAANRLRRGFLPGDPLLIRGWRQRSGGFQPRLTRSRSQRTAARCSSRRM